MPLTLNNCTIKNNTAVVIRVIPNDNGGVAFNIPANGDGDTVNSGNIVFETIQVSQQRILSTNADIVAEGLKCYFNLENNQYVLSIPDDFAAVFK